METLPYSRLAEHYDRLMGHVHYDQWAVSIAKLLKRHKHKPKRLLELGAGTCKLAIFLEIPSLEFRVHTDLSLPMLKSAMPDFTWPRAACDASAIPFADHSFDFILMCYDAVNYLDAKQIRLLFEEVKRVLVPGGIFLFDITTEENSIEWFEDYCDAFEAEGQMLVRRSSYDVASRVQHNWIDIFEPLGGDSYHRIREHHQQYIYPVPTLCEWLNECDLGLVDLVDAHTLRPATQKSDRIHFMVVPR